MNIALIRTMDSQGRIVIPAEIRKQMKLSDGDALELENVGMELLLRKCPTHLNRKEEMASYLSVLYSVIHCGIAICSEAHILVSAGIYLPEGTPVTEELAELVADGQELISAENCPVYPVSNTRQPVCAFFPILREDREPLALLLCSRTGQHLSEMELGCMAQGTSGTSGRNPVQYLTIGRTLQILPANRIYSGNARSSYHAYDC